VAISSFLLKKFNENKPKVNFQNEFTVPLVNPTFGVDPKSPTYNNISSGNHFTPDKVDIELPEISTEKKPDIKLPKIDYKIPDWSNLPDEIKKLMIEHSIDKPFYNHESPDYKMSAFSKLKPILNNNRTENILNPSFQRILDTISK
jgi:hypothetical protein